MSDDTTTDRLCGIAPGLWRFDTRYVRPGHTACYIVVDNGRAALVDCGVTATAPDLVTALADLGIAPEAVDWLIPTHAHLDHAGGAGRLMRQLPNARLAAHPSAAPHLIDPAQLEAGVRALYGDPFFDREYAPVEPVDAARVTETADDDVIHLGDRALRVVHTPGHAWHHESILDDATGTLLAGDAFGVGYPELIGHDGPFVIPVVPPPQFKPEVYRASVERIVALAPTRVAPAHFDVLDDPGRVGADLCRLLDGMLEACWQAGSAQALMDDLVRLFERELERRGRSDDRDAFRELYRMDIWLTAEGMWLWRRKQEQRAAEQAGGQAQ